MSSDGSRVGRRAQRAIGAGTAKQGKRARRLTWQKGTLPLANNHGWTCKPGYKVFVMGRGAVRFDVPAHWTIILPEAEDEISVKFHDLAPPKDNCRLEVSYLPLDPWVDYSGLPMTELLKVANKSRQLFTLWEGPVQHGKRPDGIEYAWSEHGTYDEIEKREGWHRVYMARANGVQPFITFDYWPEHKDWFVPVWEEVIRSLQLGQYVKDPTKRTLY